MGRPPKTKATKKAGGTYRADRDKAVELPVIVPDAPDWLAPLARKHWKKVTGLLAEQGTLATVDFLAVALLCGVLAEYLDADADVTAKGLTAETDTGYEYQRPCVGIRAKAWARLLSCCRQFGMTPSARAGILKTTDDPEDDGIETARAKATAAL